jgi:hypothetical protein
VASSIAASLCLAAKSRLLFKPNGVVSLTKRDNWQQTQLQFTTGAHTYTHSQTDTRTASEKQQKEAKKKYDTMI